MSAPGAVWKVYASAAADGSSRMSRNVQPGDPAGVHGRLSPGVVEVRGDGDDRFRDRADVPFGVLHELPQYDRRQRFRAELPTGHESAVVRIADPAFDQHGHAVRYFEGQVHRRLADNGVPGGAKVDRHSG